MLRSIFPRAHQKYFPLPLLGPVTDGFDDWLTASGFTQGSRTLAIHLLPIADKQLRRGIDEVAKLNHAVLDDCCKSRLAPAFARYVDLKPGFGAAFRSSSPHAAFPGSVPLRPKRKVLGPECCRVSGVGSHPQTRYFGGSAGSDARCSKLLLVLPPNRTAVLRSGPQFLCAISSTAKAVDLLSATEVGKLLSADARLKRNPASPLRLELTRLAIVLLFTTGTRRGELLKLTLGDYDRQEATLHIRETKFHKSRLLPINGDIADEIERYLRVRARRRLPVSARTHRQVRVPVRGQVR